MKTCIIGHITHDHYHDQILPGGCAFYGGWTHRGLGAEVHLKSYVGVDFVCYADLVGLLPNLLISGQTTTFTNEYPEDAPRIQYVDALAPPLLPSPFTQDYDLIHLAPVLAELELDAWVTAARPHTKWLGINVQGWIKVASEGNGRRRVIQKTWQPDLSTLSKIDVACVSDEDLHDQGDLIDRLLKNVRIVAWTHGAEGAEIFEYGKNPKHIGIYPTNPVDPTGAGDTFAAALMHGLASGMNVTDAGRLGAAAASIVIEATGGEALPRISDATQRMLRIGQE